MQKFIDEKGYPTFFLDLNASWLKTLLATLSDLRCLRCIAHRLLAHQQ